MLSRTGPNAAPRTHMGSPVWMASNHFTTTSPGREQGGVSRQSTWNKAQPGLCGSSAQAAHLPFPRTATWECFLSVAMASHCARMGFVTHHSPTPEGWHPTSPGSLGNTSQAVQRPTDLSNAVPRPNAPCGSPGLSAQAFHKTAWTQAEPAQQTSHAGSHRHPQGCTLTCY